MCHVSTATPLDSLVKHAKRDACDDGSYGGFTCPNGKCIYSHQKCDYINDCGDNSDEAGCDLPGTPGSCIFCYHGSLASLAYSHTGNFYQAFEGHNFEGHNSNDKCFEPDDSVPSIECNYGRCVTVVIDGQGLGPSIFRGCVRAQWLLWNTLRSTSSLKLEGNVIHPAKLVNLLSRKLRQAPPGSMDGLEGGMISLEAAMCDPADVPAGCDVSPSDPVSSEIVWDPSQCTSCYQGKLAQEMFRFQTEKRSLVAAMGGPLPHGEDSECSSSTDSKGCNKQTCLGVVLDAPGVDTNNVRVCLPQSSMAAMMLGQNNPLSSLSISVTSTEPHDIQSFFLGTPKYVPDFIEEYVDNIKAGKITIQIVSIN